MNSPAVRVETQMRLAESDPVIAEAIAAEEERQRNGLEMIASENYCSPAVREAAGSVMTNKYAEGLPGKRYYGGCACVDIAEQEGIRRARLLFGADHANVQPHSGAQANMAVYFALLEPGDRVLGMDLSHGGHLSHGSPVNSSGKLYRFSSYGVDRETGRIDWDALACTARDVRPKLLLLGFSAYPRDLDYARAREIADEVGAFLMADIAHIAGMVSADLLNDPVPYCDVVTTTTHKTLRGPRGGLILCREAHAKAIDKAVFPGTQGGPLMHIIAAKAVALGEALLPGFRDYQRRILENAQALAEGLLSHGFNLVSGGTDNHLVLVDLRNKNVTGKAAEAALDAAGITVNKNMVPFDDKSPFVTSGIRIGTPALTTRGMGPDEMKRITGWIAEVIAAVDDDRTKQRVREQVREFCSHYPLFAA